MERIENLVKLQAQIETIFSNHMNQPIILKISFCIKFQIKDWYLKAYCWY